MAAFIQTKKGVDSPLLEFITKYFPVLIGLLIATPYLMEWIAKIGANVRAADAAAAVKDKQTKAETAVKTAQINTQKSNEENKTGNIKVLSKKEDVILKPVSTDSARNRLKTRARALAYAMGTLADNGWWQGWFEDDKDIATILIKEGYNLAYLELLYQGVYTKSRILRNDVLRNLDDDQKARVIAAHKKINVTWLS